jgi:hypothetical protein
MSIRNAIFLLHAIDNDLKLREQIYSCTDHDELMECFQSLGYVFDDNEFEDAVNSLHIQCQTLENAQLLLQKADWVRYLLFMNQKAAS